MVAIKKFIRINDRINAAQVRVIGHDGSQLGVMSVQRALEIAGTHDLDLVEVAPTAAPPVCRIIEYSKFKYDLEKKEREAKKHQKQVKLKEIRLKPNIDVHDYGTKLKQAVAFLGKKDKVKINL
ncbi:MAG: translation initiation factor IF-3, partial [bacterium]|nr:translation initiation factor IF-3 [bacterium]